MTTQITDTTPPPADNSSESFIDKIPGVKFFKNLNIGVRLLIGFGILVVLALLIAAVSYFGSVPATETITRTNDIRWPITLTSASAQANLLKMQGELRSYLVLGEDKYRDRYHESEQALDANLDQLEGISELLDSASQKRLLQLRAAFEQWKSLPEPLFELRNDQLEREPGYRLLATEGSLLAGNILIDMNSMIETQAQREPSAENQELLGDMARFQGTFASMFSALRSYATTRNRIFRVEYEGNLAANQFAWERLLENRDSLNPTQQLRLDKIDKNRESFLQLPVQIFALLESDKWREDLYLFSTEAVPLAEEMEGLLNAITEDQAAALERDLESGKSSLESSNIQTIAISVVVLVLGIGLALIFRENIAGPVRRLTGVAEKIWAGDLEAQAQVDTTDEIGTLAKTFNNMTGQLRQTLVDVQNEKQRADDLLEVVIPIGVELASEKDFNRLLEKMLLEAKEFCHADAGVLYLRTKDDRLEFVIVRNDTLDISMGGSSGKDVTFTSVQEPLPLYDSLGKAQENTIVTKVAITGQSLNISNADEAKNMGLAGAEVFSGGGYQSVSQLALPLKDSEDKVIGVMQLINSKDPVSKEVVAFDENLQQMMESFSMLAVAALEAYAREQQLRQEIQELRIEIDHAKREREVQEIVDADSFRTLRAKATELRARRQKKPDDKDEE